MDVVNGGRYVMRNGSGWSGNPVSEMVMREIDRIKPRTIEEARKITAVVMDRYNRTGQPELGGCSPEQIVKLIHGNWLGTSVILKQDLPLAAIECVHPFVNARIVLLELEEMGFARATATGAFNRKFATRMFESFVLESRSRELLTKLNKVFNQSDVPYLLMLRHLLIQAGLVRYCNKEFRVTKRGRDLSVESAAGKLYAHLFQTLLQKHNLGANDSLEQVAEIQHFIGYTLYQVGRIATDWHPVAGSGRQALLPNIVSNLPAHHWLDEYYEVPDIYLLVRVLRNLKAWGLVDIDGSSQWPPNEQFRITPLYTRFIQFDLPPALKP